MSDRVKINGITLYTVKGAADELGIDKSRVTRAARRRNIGRTFGRQLMFTNADIEVLRNRPHGVRVVD